MRRNQLLSGIIVMAIMALFSSSATAARSADRVQVGRDIVVQANEKTGDLVCVACSIRVRGQTAGDVVAVAGSIAIESGAQVAGDTVAVAGSIRLDRGAQVAGDITAVAGAVRRDPQAVIAGDITSMEGAGWMLLLLLVPLLFLGGIVALIVWLVQRTRRPTPVPAYPGGPASTRL